MAITHEVSWLPPLPWSKKHQQTIDAAAKAHKIMETPKYTMSLDDEIKQKNEAKKHYILFWKEKWTLRALINIWHSNKHTPTNSLNILVQIIMEIREKWVQNIDVETYFNEKLKSTSITESKMQAILNEK